MLNRKDRRNIWVSPRAEEGGDGSEDSPFASVNEAVKAASPGETVVLRGGPYSQTVTLQDVRGELRSPIRIIADPDDEPAVFTASWYCYSIQNIVLSGIRFENTSAAALSIVGDSKFNIFKNIVLNNCGHEAECSLFTGGSGGVDNFFENIRIARREKDDTQIGILLSQSRDEEDDSIRVSRKGVVRYCDFENLGTAVVVGSGDEIDEFSYFKVEESRFTGCAEGVRIKANGTRVTDSLFRDCTHAVLHSSGFGIVVSGNRFDRCSSGVGAHFGDLAAHENCFVDSGISMKFEQCLLPDLFYNNSFVFTDSVSSCCSIEGSERCSALFSDNLFYNCPVPDCSGVEGNNNLQKNENDGTLFTNAAEGDYRTNLSVGCTGEGAYRVKINTPETVDLKEMAEILGFDAGDLSGKVEQRELYMKSLYPALAEGEDHNREEYDQDEETLF
ncbi:MAG: hypothetical protein ACQEQV_07285 [Fibrobacterota bacterium]